jgi:tagatose-6-phosphate ketose/aldose isomerase
MNDVSEYAGLTLDAMRAGRADWTAREIAQQPTLWPQLVRQVASDKALHDYLAPLLADRDIRIVCTGAGTSAYVGKCLAPALARTGRRADAIASTDIVSNPVSAFACKAPTLVVHFARSGNSPESVAAFDLAEQLIERCHQLVITCNSEGNLLRHAQEKTPGHWIVLPDACNDRSFAMTSSFTGMLLAAAQALHIVTPLPGRIERLASLGEEVLKSLVPRVKAMVRAQFDRIIFLGSNELKGVARESALKMLELTSGRVVSMAESPLGFRHGPKSIVNENTLVVCFLSNDPYTRQYDESLLREIRKDGRARQVIALTTKVPGDHSGDIIELGAAGESQAAFSDVELCLPYVAFAQILALHQSLSLGISPDSPNETGTVHRVVRGVEIYPFPFSEQS